MTTIVCSSDWHADISTLGVSRYVEISVGIETSLMKARELRAAAYVFVGDLADPDNGGATLKAIEFAQLCALQLDSWGIPSVWISGNHDVVDDGSGATVLSPMRVLDCQFERIMVVQDPKVVQLAPDLALMCLPFTPICRSYDPDAWVRKHWPAEGRVIVAAHLMIPGIVPGEETHEMPRGRDVIFPLDATRKATARISGHYHRAQDFDPGDGGPAIHIVGSPIRCTFGTEEHVPSFLVLEV